MDNQTTPERILLSTDTNSVTQIQNAVQNTLHLMQAVLDAWNAITELTILPAFTTDDLQSLFNDMPTFISNVKESYYQAKFGEAHAAIGIIPAAGIKMVQLPDLTAISDAVIAYSDAINVRDGYRIYCDVQYFMITDNQVIVNTDFYNARIDAQSYYITTDNQIAAYNTLKTFIEALQAVDNIFRPLKINILLTNSALGPVVPIENSPLNQILNFKYDSRWDTAVTITPNNSVFKKIN